MRTRKWTDASGQEKYSTEIVAETMQMLGGKPVGGSEGGGESYSRAKSTEQSAPAASSSAASLGAMDDDIPF